MKVILPKEYIGQEIVDAFKSAAEVRDSRTKKWQIEEFVHGYQYERSEAGGVWLLSASKGVKITSWAFEDVTTGFFSRKKRKKWVESSDYTVTLQALDLAKKHKEVDIEPRYVQFCGIHYTHVVTCPHDHGYEAIRPDFEVLLARFYTALIKTK